MVWKLIDQLSAIKDINVRAMTLNAKLDDAKRAEMQTILQPCNDRRILLALKLVHGKVSAAVLSEFAVWLALQGRDTFEAVIADPDKLADFDTIGSVEKVGHFKFKGPTGGPKWGKAEARANLGRMLAKYSKTAKSGKPIPPVDAPSAVSQLQNDPVVPEIRESARSSHRATPPRDPEPSPVPPPERDMSRTEQMPSREALLAGEAVKPPDPADDDPTVEEDLDEVGAAVKLMRILFRAEQSIDMEGRFELQPKRVHGLYLVTLREGPKFARPPHSPEGQLIWKAMHEVETGQTIGVDGVGALSKTEREAFSGFDPLLGRERTVPAQVVYTLRLNIPGEEV